MFVILIFKTRRIVNEEFQVLAIYSNLVGNMIFSASLDNFQAFFFNDSKFYQNQFPS